jgi:hypothetical protein
MRNILALIGAAVLVFAVLGWYFGWYQLGTEPAADGHRKINVGVDPEKIVKDVEKAEQKVGNLITNDTKGTTVTPTPSTAPVDKKVPGQPTGFQFDANGGVTFTPPKVEFKTIE